MSSHLIAIVLAVCIDRVIGDPQSIPHPVVGMGKLISFFDRKLNDGTNRRAKGICMLVFVIATVGIVSVTVVTFSYMISMYVGIIMEAVLISFTIAAKGLQDAANEVKKPLAEGDIEQAREKLSHIVGRETNELNEEEIIRATVETVAENTTDGITAPLFFAFIGGAPLALIYRAINTCDSMVGYRNKTYAQFGWASARLDDIVNFIPSRLTGLMMVIVTKPKENRSTRHCWQIVQRDAPLHESPNSGWNEAAVAALLGIQLGGSNTYAGVVEHRATMGDDLVKMSNTHIAETNRIMMKTVIFFTLFLVICGGVIFVIT